VQYSNILAVLELSILAVFTNDENLCFPTHLILIAKQ